MTLIVIAAAQAPQSVPPVPLFRSGVNIVTVDVSVLDKERRPVRGLTAADFTILENGKPQPVMGFSAIDLPDTDAPQPVWLRETRPDTVRNDDFADRRTIIVVLDDATPMPAGEGRRVIEAARLVIEQLGPDDLAAVVYTFDKTKGQELTRDRVRLLASADRFMGGTTGFKLDPAGRVVEIPFSSYDPSAMTMHLATIETLRSLAEALTELPQRRKALVFISVGIALDMGNLAPRVIAGEHSEASGQSWRLVQELLGAFTAAHQANVNIYCIDPGGLRPSATPLSLNSDFLRAVSSNTGGFAITDDNDPGPGIAQVFRENSSYYLLGYQNPDPRSDGRYRRIEVHVSRPGVTVRARDGYFEPTVAKNEKKKAAKAPPSLLAAALDGPVQKTDVPLQVTAAAFPVAGRRNAAVAIIVGIRTPAPAGPGPAADNIDVQASAYDTNGKRRGAARVTGRVVRQPGYAGATGYEALLRLDLKPGRYQLRVAAESSLLGKSGSVYTDVDVPDFTKVGVTMSGLVMSVTPGAPSAPKDGLRDLLPVSPTSERLFARDDKVTAMLRLCQGEKKPLVPVTLVVRIVDARDATVFEDTATLGPERFLAGRLADYRVDLPIAALRPGRHLLMVEAAPAAGLRPGAAVIRRDVQFSVR
jgi:VWFA-related protein